MPQQPTGPPLAGDRRAAGVACARMAVHLYEHLQPGDERLRRALGVVEPFLLGAGGGGTAPRHTLDAALQTACDCGVETEHAASVAADAVASLCTAALAQHDDQPSSLVVLFASLACSHAAAAVALARDAATDGPDRGALDRALAPLRPAFEAALAQWPVQPTRTWAPSPPFPPEEPSAVEDAEE